jgi:hypothetical protein
MLCSNREAISGRTFVRNLHALPARLELEDGQAGLERTFPERLARRVAASQGV